MTGLIVKALELRSETAADEDGMGAVIGELDLVSGAGGHGFYMDVVAIVVVD